MVQDRPSSASSASRAEKREPLITQRLDNNP